MIPSANTTKKSAMAMLKPILSEFMPFFFFRMSGTNAKQRDTALQSSIKPTEQSVCIVEGGLTGAFTFAKILILTVRSTTRLQMNFFILIPPYLYPKTYREHLDYLLIFNFERLLICLFLLKLKIFVQLKNQLQ